MGIIQKHAINILRKMKRFKVLIIRFRRVGDAVLSSSLCTSLKRSNPDIEIHYVVDENIGDLFDKHPDIDAVVKFSVEEKKSYFIYLKKIWSLMRNEKYDAIIDTRSTINTLYFSLFSLGSHYRIGLKKEYTKFIFNYRVENVNGMSYIKEIQMLLRPLNKEFRIPDNNIFRLCFSENEKSEIKDEMKREGINFKKPLIFCAVATRLVYKRWDFDNMKDVLQFLIKEYDAQLIFNFSGNEETVYANNLYFAMGCDPHIFINIASDSLRRMALLMSNCHCFFGNEGGPRHISQALGIPSFAIFPPDISTRVWLPNPDSTFVGIEPADINKSASSNPVASYREIFDLITAEEVKKRLKKFLSTHLNRAYSD